MLVVWVEGTENVKRERDSESSSFTLRRLVRVEILWSQIKMSVDLEPTNLVEFRRSVNLGGEKRHLCVCQHKMKCSIAFNYKGTQLTAAVLVNLRPVPNGNHIFFNHITV